MAQSGVRVTVGGASAVVAVLAGMASAQAQLDPNQGHLPRYMTEAERALVAKQPIRATDAPTPPPVGPVATPGEYAPSDGVMFSHTGSTGWLTILRKMAKEITTVGNAKVYVNVTSSTQIAGITTQWTTEGVDMSKVEFMVNPLNSIWVRDYGPRYAYEGGVRVVVDHKYNRPRPLDDVIPAAFAAYKGHQFHEMDLIHGGGNYHLNSMGEGYATKLITNENPTKTPAQVVQIWQDYLNVNTYLTDAFATTIDATQHIDMWLIVTGDKKALINDYPLAQNSAHDLICEFMTTKLTGEGWTITRLPAFNISGVHYTYANSVIVNDLVLIPTYTVSQAVTTYNAQALAAWQAAMPGFTIKQIDCQAIVSAAGVMHCIMMHIPANLGGANPTAYVRSPNGGTVNVGDAVDVAFISDDDNKVQNVDILLSRDGGQTFPYVLASQISPAGPFAWTVDRLPTTQGRIRVVARDAQGNTGFDDSDADITIVGCYADCDGSGTLNVFDYICFGNAYAAAGNYADCNGDGTRNVFDYICFGNEYAGGCP